MARSVSDLEGLGERVAGALGSLRAQRELAVEDAHRRFLESALRKAPPVAPRPRHWALAAATLAALVVALFVVTRSAPLTFTADGKEIAPETWIAAPAERALPLAFSDGTSLRVEPSARVRVVAIDEHGASVALENGSVHAEVVHRPESAWRLIAGPITVRVTGTRFDLRWSASTEELFLSVAEGSVAVTGSVVGAERPVRAGETLRVAVAEGRLELTSGEARAEQAAPPAPATSQVAADSQPSNSVEPGTASNKPLPAASAPEAPDWRALAKSGSLRKAYAAAEASGFDAACQAASPAELLLLGDAARLSGRPDRANQALLALRKQYPSDSRRAAAAFALGKVAFDQSRAYAQAAEWFRTSIREQPGGSLAREAAGRLIEALQRAGDAAGARRAAEDYLLRYPNGPHADVARSATR